MAASFAFKLLRPKSPPMLPKRTARDRVRIRKAVFGYSLIPP
jgi:hypothetical protein